MESQFQRLLTARAVSLDTKTLTPPRILQVINCLLARIVSRQDYDNG